jgi:toxin ParE1/3/4
MRAHFTPQAEIDLEPVGDHIALDNPLRAISFIGEIRQHCEKIADGPHHYVARPDLGDAIRICAHGNYLIAFEPFEDGALILRVLHGARNVPGVFGLNDPLIAICVGQMPNQPNPFVIYRCLSPPSGSFWR